MRHVKQVIAAGIFALSLTVGAGLASDVAARDDVPSGGDSHQRACYALQQKVDLLVAEYGKDGTTDRRRKEILNELKQLGSDWIAIGCRNRYGDIAIVLPEPDAPYRHPGVDLEQPNWETYRDY